MADQSSLLEKFVNVTAVDEERARFYLESSAWQLEVALASFYEEDNNDEVVPQERERDQEEAEEDSEPAIKVTASKPSSRPKSSSRFATVNSLNSSSSDEEGQAFYAGGSEHSGQQVLGPSKKHKDFVSEMFKSVQEHGAEVVEPHTSSHSQAFQGTGYRLGQSNNDTQVVESGMKRPSHTEITLKLWREGFSVNDGELRNYADPNNKEFLESIKRGEIPTELIRDAKGREVHLNMEDHRHEEFIKPRMKTSVFAGKGYTLGSPTPGAVGAPSEQTNDTEANESEAKRNMSVDKTQPTTSIQIRLADGSRLLGEFNHTHTVADIRTYIMTARPQYENREFILMSSYPSRELTDVSQTLKDAGLLNAAIMQRLK